MASNTAELAASLSQDDIPIKLRCASCNKLVLNGFRLPCCDQNICETCQETLPESCPVCMHSPLSADDCKPNKALRLTVKAFLKNEEKKRSKEQAESATLAPAATTSLASESAPPPIASVNTPVPSVETPLEQDTTQSTAQDGPATEGGVVAEADNGRRSASSSVEITLEAPEDNYESQSNHKGFGGPSYDPYSGPASQVANAGATPDQTNQSQPSWNQFQNDRQSQPQQNHQMGNASGFGFGGMNGMAAAGQMNPMASGTMDMQNNMNNMNFSTFPMMGMPGMGMDFMSMASGMFPGFNGQGMGMDGMNGMNNMNGFNMGMGFDGSFGNFGANSSNMSMSGGFDGGNFGANAGYYPSSGYNQQMHQSHFNQMHPNRFNMNNNHRQNRFNGPGYFRDRGRGRFHSHNRFSQGPNNFHSAEVSQNWQDPRASESRQLTETKGRTPHDDSQAPQHGEAAQAAQSQDEINASEGNQGNAQTDDQFDGQENISEVPELEPQNEVTEQSEPSAQHPQEQTLPDGQEVSAAMNDDNITAVESSEPQPIATVDTSRDHTMDSNVGFIAQTEIEAHAINAPRGPAAQFTDHAGRGRGFVRGFGRGMYDYRGRFRGRGMGRSGQYIDNGREYRADSGPAAPPEPLGQGVEGAPTGPKAMREGLPNTAIRGRGGFPNAARGGRSYTFQRPSNESGTPKTSDLIETGGDHNAPRSKSRTRSPSQSRARSSSSQQRRHHPRSRNQSAHGAVEENNQYREQQYDDQPREANNYLDHELPETDERASRSRDRSMESHTRQSSRRRERKRRSSRHDRDRSRDKRRNRHRSRSPLNGVHNPDTQYDKHAEHTRQRSRHDANYQPLDDRISKRPREHRTRSRSRSPDRDRDRGREREHDRSRSDRHKHRPTREDASKHDTAAAPQQAPPPPPQREFKIKDRSKRTELEVQKELVREENPDIDPNTLEREARNRERMLKEQQRRESIAGPRGNSDGSNQGRKRSFAAVYEDEIEHKMARRRKDRDGRAGYRYGREESDVARALRVESEREAARWR